MTQQFVSAVETYYYCLFTFFFFFFALRLIFVLPRGCDFLLSASFFLVYFLYVVYECVPSVIFPVQRTTSGVGDRPNRHKWTIAAQDEGEWDTTEKQDAEIFMTKWIVAKRARAVLYAMQ